jgi:hypothetical protein
MPQSRHGYLIAAIACAVLMGYGYATASAEVLELEGTVKAVDAESRAISIVRKTPKGEKVLDWEVAKKAGAGSVRELAEASPVMAVAFHPDGKRFASGTGAVRLWNMP